MLLDVATRQDFLELRALLEKVLSAQPPVTAAADELLTLDEVAAYTKFNRRTVRQWVTAGRYDTQGRRIYLPALQFNDLLRFRRGDVEAFGLGTGVLEPAVASAPPQPTKTPPAVKAPRRQKGAVPSTQALKIA